MTTESNMKVNEVNSRTIVTVHGKGMWASVLQPKKGYADSPPQYSVNIEFTKDNLTTLKTKHGLMSKKKLVQQNEETYQDEEGRTYLQVGTSSVDKAGNTVPGPAVINTAGGKQTELVGNGSDLTVQFELVPYENKFGKGYAPRLLAVKVNKLVPYTKTRTYDYEALGVTKEALENATTQNQTTCNEDDDFSEVFVPSATIKK